ncbi:bcl-2-binding component 3 isoform X3 [Myotis myotis]|uniref:bcl-2-binding component 3 isoform X3 n=1 Tax=Myotis myotis TaxID=51298 RepID=UPI00174A5D2C|nr:bcl-2-binding component 3 isoform X3 [Myotis myotis]
MGCGLDSAPWRSVRPRGSESTPTAPSPAVRSPGGVGGGGTEWRGGHTPGAHPLGAATGGGLRPRSLRLLRAGAAPQQQPVIGPALAWRAGRAHVAAAGLGGCDSAGGRLAPPWERACAGLWICRCLARAPGSTMARARQEGSSPESVEGLARDGPLPFPLSRLVPSAVSCGL